MIIETRRSTVEGRQELAVKLIRLAYDFIGLAYQIGSPKLFFLPLINAIPSHSRESRNMSRKRERQDDSAVVGRPMKHKRQFTEKDRNRASIWEQLADEKHETRIQAAKKLVDEFAPDEQPDVEKLKDVLVRLIKGHSSGRKAARAGYFVALSELLRQISTSKDLFTEAVGSVQDLLQLIHRLTKSNRDLPQVSYGSSDQ
jgi:hypothetical protein